ncbi:hypothetical protein LXL04_008328 [Taraxacum kok-saghyz]
MVIRFLFSVFTVDAPHQEEKHTLPLCCFCHVLQHGIIARGLSTHKISHLTKPTSKLPVPTAMGQKRSKIKC